MAIISDIQEDQNAPETKPSQASPSSKAASFTAKLDRSNPLGFVEKVFDFLAQESDYLKKPTAEKEVLSVVRVVREKEIKKVEEEKKKKRQEEEEEKTKKKAKEEAKVEEKKETPLEEGKKEKKGLRGTDLFPFL